MSKHNVAVVLHVDFYRILDQLEILEPSSTNVQGGCWVELDSRNSRLIMTGIALCHLLASTTSCAVVAQEANTLLNELSTSSKAEKRLHNWNQIQNLLSRAGSSSLLRMLDTNTKDLIVHNQDSATCVELMQNVAAALGWLSHHPSSTEEYDEPTVSVVVPLHEDVVSKDVVRELLELNLMRHLSLRPDQVSSLIETESRFLSRILVSGIEESSGDDTKTTKFDPVLSLLTSLLEEKVDLSAGVIHNPFNLSELLRLFESGIISKNRSVAIFTIELLSTFLKSPVTNTELQEIAFQWLKGSSSTTTTTRNGLYLICKCKRRFPDLKDKALTLLIQYASTSSLHKVLGATLRSHIAFDEEYIGFIHDVLLKMKENDEELHDELRTLIVDVSCRVLTTQTSSSHHSVDSPDHHVAKASAIALISNLWITYPKSVSSHRNSASTILNALKCGFRDKCVDIQVTAIGASFEILRQLEDVKNNVPTLATTEIADWSERFYKTLVFALIEGSANIFLRDFALQNLCKILPESPTLSVNTVVEPLLKSISIQGYSTTEIKLLSVICNVRQLSVQPALHLVKWLIGVAVNDVAYSTVSLSMICKLLGRFKNSPLVLTAVHEWCSFVIATLRKGTKDDGCKRTLLLNAMFSMIDAAQEQGLPELYSFIENLIAASLDNEVVSLGIIPLLTKVGIPVPGKVRVAEYSKQDSTLPKLITSSGKIPPRLYSPDKAATKDAPSPVKALFPRNAPAKPSKSPKKRLRNNARRDLDRLKEEKAKKQAEETEALRVKEERKAKIRDHYNKKVLHELQRKKEEQGSSDHDDESSGNFEEFERGFKSSQKAALMRIYKQYGNLSVGGGGGIATTIRDSTNSFEKLGNDLMGFVGWIRFLQEYKIVPKWIDLPHAKKLYRRTESSYGIDFTTFLQKLHEVCAASTSCSLVADASSEDKATLVVQQVLETVPAISSEDHGNGGRDLFKSELKTVSAQEEVQKPPRCASISATKVKTYEQEKAEKLQAEENERRRAEAAFQKRRAAAAEKLKEHKREQKKKLRIEAAARESEMPSSPSRKVSFSSRNSVQFYEKGSRIEKQRSGRKLTEATNFQPKSPPKRSSSPRKLSTVKDEVSVNTVRRRYTLGKQESHKEDGNDNDALADSPTGKSPRRPLSQKPKSREDETRSPSVSPSKVSRSSVVGSKRRESAMRAYMQRRKN